MLDAAGFRSDRTPWQDATWVSLHGQTPEALANTLQSRPAALAVLTDPGQGGAATVRQILQQRPGGVLCRVAVREPRPPR